MLMSFVNFNLKFAVFYMNESSGLIATYGYPISQSQLLKRLSSLHCMFLLLSDKVIFKASITSDGSDDVKESVTSLSIMDRNIPNKISHINCMHIKMRKQTNPQSL